MLLQMLEPTGTATDVAVNGDMTSSLDITERTCDTHREFLQVMDLWAGGNANPCL